MSKIQAIFGLFLLLVVIFSMDMIFGSLLRESFKTAQEEKPYKFSEPFGGGGGGGRGGGRGLGLGRDMRFNTLNGNLRFSGRGFLGDTQSYPDGDDQPLFFGFSDLFYV